MVLLIVDGANVVGSRPDGWWRDRLGAARRLRDALIPVAEAGLPGLAGPLEVVLVVEGRAAGLVAEPAPVPLRVVAARGSGDDEIVSLVRNASGPTTVVTADRGLRDRVRPLGAAVLGPRSLPY
ncbi:MAG TPA: hypothetical protein VHA75_17150 [Rugosimonospora sp.]|nr:hypothetical protein [Rugosimonospora sp.]